jgi:hypothetical protein
MFMKELFDYNQLFYNDCIDYLETKWNRRLTEHERTVLLEGYKFGRMVESENEIKILCVK